MKQFFAILFALLLTLPLAGCETRAGRTSSAPMPESETKPEPESESEPEPEPEQPEENELDIEGARQAAEEMLTALATGNPDTIRRHIDYKNLLMLESDESPDESLLAILKRLKFEVVEAQASSEDSAAVTAELTNVNMEAIFADYLRRAAELEYNNAISDSPLPAEDMEAEYQKLFLEMIGGAGTTSTTVIIRMEQSGDGWRAQVSDALRDAATGGYFSARNRVGVNAGAGNS